MKILHFVPVYAPAWSYGGPVRSISALAEEQVRQGHEVAVLTTNAGLDVVEGVVADKWTGRNGVEVCYCRREAGPGIKSSSLEERVRVRVGEFDVMHLSAIWHPVARAAHHAARRRGVPVIVSSRGALGSYAWQRRRWLKKIYYALFERSHFKTAAGFHFTSKAEAAESGPYILGKPYCVVPNGINENAWRRNEPAALAWRHAQGFGKNDLLLLYVGRLHHKKGLGVLPSALAKVQRAFPGRPLRFVLVGPNEDGTLGQLQKEMARVAMSRCLVWISTMPEGELPPVYSAANIFLMPSLHENFGNSAVEALACGCPALVSAETGCLEFGYGCGMRDVPRHDSECWADAITETLQRGPGQLTNEHRLELIRRVGLRSNAAKMVGFYEAMLDCAKHENA